MRSRAALPAWLRAACCIPWARSSRLPPFRGQCSAPCSEPGWFNIWMPTGFPFCSAASCCSSPSFFTGGASVRPPETETDSHAGGTPIVGFSSHAGGDAGLLLRGCSLQPVRGGGRDHPRPLPDRGPGHSDPHRHRDVSLRPDHHHVHRRLGHAEARSSPSDRGGLDGPGGCSSGRRAAPFSPAGCEASLFAVSWLQPWLSSPFD
jgi:hypothetical protein